MRVLHVLHNSLPLICGYSIRSGNIVRLQKRDGYELKVVTSAQHPNGAAMREEIDGVEHRRTPSYHGKQWPLWREWQLMRRLAREVDAAVTEWRPDLVHAHSPVLVGLPALRVARRHRLPLVYEIRDLWENALVDRGRFGHGSALYRLARRVEGHVLTRADAVVTICETLRVRAQEATRARGQGPRGGERGRRGRVPAPRALGGGPAEVRAGRQERGPLRRYVPALRGLGVARALASRVLARRPDAHLVIVGGSASLAYRGGTTRGTQEEVLGRAISELRLTDHVTMTGRVPHGEVADLYSIADCVVYPRILTRTTALTTPLKPLEAMAMGKPVAASDLPPMRELVRDRETGLTFPAGDEAAVAQACIALLEDAPLRARLGQAARDFVVAERQWPDLVKRYDAVYESALRG